MNRYSFVAEGDTDVIHVDAREMDAAIRELYRVHGHPLQVENYTVKGGEFERPTWVVLYPQNHWTRRAD
jgi:hypothetical protein